MTKEQKELRRQLTEWAKSEGGHHKEVCLTRSPSSERYELKQACIAFFVLNVIAFSLWFFIHWLATGNLL